MIGVRHALTQVRIERLDNGERIRNLKSRQQTLQPQMILFVHHYARAARQMNSRAAFHRTLRVETRELAAHKMSLVQQQTIFRRQFIDANEHTLIESANSVHCIANLRQNAQTLAVPRSAGEGIALEIPRETNASGYHDVGTFTGRIEPSDSAVRK
jgi:hypothetical protein